MKVFCIIISYIYKIITVCKIPSDSPIQFLLCSHRVEYNYSLQKSIRHRKEYILHNHVDYISINRYLYHYNIASILYGKFYSTVKIWQGKWRESKWIYTWSSEERRSIASKNTQAMDPATGVCEKCYLLAWYPPPPHSPAPGTSTLIGHLLYGQSKSS